MRDWDSGRDAASRAFTEEGQFPWEERSEGGDGGDGGDGAAEATERERERYPRG